MRDCLQGGSIPSLVCGENITLVDELTGPNYGMVTRKGGEAILLEGKKEMRTRGVPSPNVADALACTFAYPSFEYVAPIGEAKLKPVVADAEYDPFSHAAIYGVNA